MNKEMTKLQAIAAWHSGIAAAHGVSEIRIRYGRASGGGMRAFIFAAVLAASIGALTGYSFADMPQVYQSNSTGEVKGWEDAEGYHACRNGQDCHVPQEYDLVWVE